MERNAFIACIIVGLLVILSVHLIFIGIIYKAKLLILFGGLAVITLILFYISVVP